MVAFVELAQTLGGLRFEDRAVETLGLDAQAVVERPALPGAGRFEIGSQCWLGERGDGLREFERPLYTGAGWHHFVDEADAFGLTGVDDPAGDDEVDRAAVTQDAGEPLGAAVGQPDVPAPARDPEGGVLVGDREVRPSVARNNRCISGSCSELKVKW